MLDRLLTRLALCDDSKLQPLLSKLLPFTVSSLSSNSSAVRNKVLEILSHVNKRVKHQPEIALPLSELWNIYSEANAASMVRNFCILYIEMAMDRADTKEKENLAATLLSGVSKLPLQHHEIILRLATKVMGECHSSGVNDEVAANTHASQQRMPTWTFDCSNPPCYRKQPLKSYGAGPELVYPLYVAASVDCQEPVVKKGEELLKKKAAGANLDDSDLINTLFLLFNGTAGAQNVAPDLESLLQSCFKSKTCIYFPAGLLQQQQFPFNFAVHFCCIYGSDTTSRLKQLGNEFTVWVFKHLNELTRLPDWSRFSVRPARLVVRRVQSWSIVKWLMQKDLDHVDWGFLDFVLARNCFGRSRRTQPTF
ncbi:unnamed protein product [Prunus armeniaca]|uniref:Proteasome component Ecm29 N-terminal domain-containing protein n=1 Tax=Prunus armeniaca TaxID=36596 RepID=A0A6J5XCT9_PRUAR|nr:unnamed protein product [Prunus armeniaca]